VVLRRQPLRDSQDLLVLFTPQGRLDCIARGTSKRSGLCEPLTCLSLQLSWGRARSSLPQLQEAMLERTFTGILADFDLLAAAGYLVGLWLEAFPSETEESAAYRLLRIALEGLDVGVAPAWLLAWVEIQVLRLLGLSPELRQCILCGARPVTRFSVEAGGVTCSRCSPPGAWGMSAEVWEWLQFLRRSPVTAVGSAQPQLAAARRVQELTRACVLAAFPGLARLEPERWTSENPGN
jgi:DNA repair protein RecO (recombination protein O)